MSWKVIAVLAATTLAACSDDEITATASASLAGTYTLQTVNGAALPLVVQASNPKIEVTSEQLVVSSNGTFTIATNRRSTTAAGAVTTATVNDGGTYTTSGSQTTFRFNSGNTAAAALSGSRLTLTASGSTSVYAK